MAIDDRSPVMSMDAVNRESCKQRAFTVYAFHNRSVVKAAGTPALVCCVVGLFVDWSAAEDTTKIDFDEQVAPLLAERCLECHNGSDKEGGLDLAQEATTRAGGDSGAALVPNDLKASLLWERVSTDEMPPEHPLSDAEKETFRKWILAGATWGDGPIDIFRYSSPDRADYNWWSLTPIRRPSPPAASANDWPTSPIDRFVLENLDESGLGPSPEASRRTLIRRLSFGLHGLPPAPDEVQAFLGDEAPGAYERLVDRLLASPAFGERWARHWLDIIRFGESHGFERDQLRDHSWRYRDWVVDAFNSDLPYDEFVRLQLAGDVLRPGDPRAVIATGFLVAGPYDQVGQSQQSAAMRAVVRQDELEDIISAVGQTFLGLTVNCARCHDHKFDPVRQTEYYQFAAALAGVKHGEQDLGADPSASTSRQHASAIQSQLGALRRSIEAIEQPARQRLLAARRNRSTEAVTVPDPIARWEFDVDLLDSVGTLNGEQHGSASVTNGHLRVDGKTGYVTTAPLTHNLTEKTLEVWLKLETLLQRGGGAVSVQTLDGAAFDAIVFGEREPGQWMAGSDGFRRTSSFGGTEEKDAQATTVHVAITWRADGTITGYRNGLPYGEPYQSDGPIEFKAGEAQVLFGLRHAPPGGNRFLAGRIDRAQLYDRALTPDEVAASAGVESNFISEEQLAAELTDQERAWRETLRFEADHLQRQLARARATLVYAVNSTPNPEPMHVLLRGNPNSPGDIVSPGGIASVLPDEADFGLAADAADGERRRALAEWITEQRNPLFARVIVNRLWQYHFGIGFVDTPSDLGYNGGIPTHPELLDWLASELIESGWSLKHLHRLILTSATYRQSSHPTAEALDIDADNRLLWRKSPQRLEAEALRDAILTVSAELNPAVGGPGYHDFTTFTRNTQFYEPVDAVGHSFNRRSLYRAWVRSGRNQFLDVFDCPDPSSKAPQRAVTTTPLQALSLMNNSFVLRMADRFAERLQTECGDDRSAQVALAYELIYSRRPEQDEQLQASQFADENGLAMLCRVLFNTNEFLYVE